MHRSAHADLKIAAEGDLQFAARHPHANPIADSSQLAITLAAAQLLLPEARVKPAPRSQMPMRSVWRSTTSTSCTLVRFGNKRMAFNLRSEPMHLRQIQFLHRHHAVRVAHRHQRNA